MNIPGKGTNRNQESLAPAQRPKQPLLKSRQRRDRSSEPGAVAPPPAKKIRQRGPKVPLEIDQAVHLIRDAIAPFRKAAMFELAYAGFNSLFEQLVACIISIRTLDEV